ncbi:hypothetical protein ACQ4PT_001796 [Festuca glaucescens]
MRPILMKGHERPLTFLKYNRDGDLLFSCAKDHTPTVWSPTTATASAPTAGTTARFDAPARSVDFAIGDHLAVITTDSFMGNMPTAQVKRIAEDLQDQTDESALVISGITGRINRAVWGPGNRTIITAGEDATIRIWDSETGKLLKESGMEEGHQKAISSLSKSADWSHFLTGSLDKSAKLWDARTLTLIKTYVTERPLMLSTYLLPLTMWLLEVGKML